jgi:hypothetical protein
MTPIQELKEQLVEEDIRSLSVDYYLQKEKEFAKQCFEAGKLFVDFKEWYKKFEQ